MPRAEDQSWQLTIRLPRDLEPVIREIARQRVVAPAIAVRQLVKERVDQLEHEQTQGYRSLEDGEQAIRQTCPQCGDKHVALFNRSTGASQCRACNATFFVNAKPRP